MSPNRLNRLRIDLADAQDEGTPVKLRPVDLAELLTTFDEVRLLRAEKTDLQRVLKKSVEDYERLREADRRDINKLEEREAKLRARIDELENPKPSDDPFDPANFAKIGL